MTSAITFVLYALGVLIGVYALAGIAVLVLFRRAAKGENIFSIPRRRSSPQVPPRRNPTQPGPDPRYEPKQFRSKR